MTQNKKEGWEKRFNELFVYNDGGVDADDEDSIKVLIPSEIKSFISSLLHEREEEIVKIVNKWGDSLDEVINKVIKRK